MRFYDNQVLFDKGYETLATKFEAVMDKAPELESELTDLVIFVTNLILVMYVLRTIMNVVVRMDVTRVIRKVITTLNGNTQTVMMTALKMDVLRAMKKAIKKVMKLDLKRDENNFKFSTNFNTNTNTNFGGVKLTTPQ